VSHSGDDMRKRIIVPDNTEPRPGSGPQWLELDQIATVELTSEDPDFPIEAALTNTGIGGWRASQKGKQVIRIIFDRPRSLRRIRVEFSETETPRTQEFTLQWSQDGSAFKEVIRQQWNFNPGDSASEIEEYQVALEGVSALELNIKPDLNPDNARASLLAWRVA
jgi:uncharacterized protein (DUF736 family)